MIWLWALIPGLAIPAVSGWLGLRVIEGRHPVLLRAERWILGSVWGLSYGMLAAFALNAFLNVPFTFATFLLVYVTAGVVFFALFFWQRLSLHTGPVHLPHSPPLSKRATIIWSILIGWIVLRALAAGTTFLLLTPTYLDDTLDNWNLRGKVFYHTQTLTLVLPNEDPLTSPMGVSSYPPAVPLMKAWLATIAGAWSEPLVNGIHLLWYAGAIVLVYAAVRRQLPRPWALLGAYLIGSLPLFQMHGTNTYADAFMAVHIFAAVSMLFAASRLTGGRAGPESQGSRDAFLRLAIAGLAILPFTKNEGVLVYLPPLVLLLLGIMWMQTRRRERSATSMIGVIVALGIALALVAGPWLIFKWQNGLTFGNAKPFTSLGIAWQPNVLYSITVNTLLEGNWHLLFALAFALLIWQWRNAFSRYGLLTLFFLIVYLGQASLYLFTRLSVEALKQTGYARGLVHLIPTIVLLVTLLLHDASPPFLAALKNREP